MTNATLPAATANYGDVSYRGCGLLDRPGGGRFVYVETGGESVGLLPHRVKHSPTGMTWGYDGSGPADLARSLLIHALDTAARCVVCDGTNEVVHDSVTGTEVPARNGVASPRFSAPMRCTACDGGWAVRSSTYRQFQLDVVARLPESGWTLGRADVLAWLEQHGQKQRG
jgi:hypothetical protein